VSPRTRVAVCAAIFAVQTSAAQKPSGCASDWYRVLDFWIGSWDVHLRNGTLAGTDIVEKTLDGCVVLEHWTDVNGNRGESFFYYHPAEKVWKQVWVVPSGAMKEKQATPPQTPGPIRFAGKAYLPDGRAIHDHTTLTPQTDGTVQQVIEQSSDGGKTWHMSFDAIHSKRH